MSLTEENNTSIHVQWNETGNRWGSRQCGSSDSHSREWISIVTEAADRPPLYWLQSTRPTNLPTFSPRIPPTASTNKITSPFFLLIQLLSYWYVTRVDEIKYLEYNVRSLFVVALRVLFAQFSRKHSFFYHLQFESCWIWFCKKIIKNFL